MSAGAVSHVLARAMGAGLSKAAALEALSDEALAALLYGARRLPATERPTPNRRYVHIRASAE